MGFIGLCLLVAVSDAGFTASSMNGWYRALIHPPGTLPDWVFGPVWTLLYVLIGVSAWLVWQRQDTAPQRTFVALRLWGWQLLLNAVWTPALFGLRSPILGLVVILSLLVLILLTIIAFRRVRRTTAAALLVPYAAWVVYVTYLNAGILFLNYGR